MATDEEISTGVQLIEQALASQSPAQLSVVVPCQMDVAFNRRYFMKDGTVGWNPRRMESNVLGPLGPVDPELPFVLIRDQNSMPIDRLSDFAMHTAVFGGPPFGACYPGFLQTALRQRLASDDFLSIFAEGCAWMSISNQETRLVTAFARIPQQQRTPDPPG